MNLIELKPGDDVDASVLEHNFTELKNAISENANIDARIDGEIIPVLAQLKEADTKTKNDLSSAQQGLSSDIKAVQNNLSGSQSKITNLEKRIYISETYSNGTSWYRIWSADSTGKKWCEQGGTIPEDNMTITLLKKLVDTNYTCLCICSYSRINENFYIDSKTTTTFNVRYASGGTWFACGYLA